MVMLRLAPVGGLGVLVTVGVMGVMEVEPTKRMPLGVVQGVILVQGVMALVIIIVSPLLMRVQVAVELVDITQVGLIIYGVEVVEVLAYWDRGHQELLQDKVGRGVTMGLTLGTLEIMAVVQVGIGVNQSTVVGERYALFTPEGREVTLQLELPMRVPNEIIYTNS